MIVNVARRSRFLGRRQSGQTWRGNAAQGLADAYLAYLKKGPKPSGLYVLR
jgi:hypothetical protein